MRLLDIPDGEITHAIITIPPHEQPYQLFMGGENDALNGLYFVGEFVPLGMSDADVYMVNHAIETKGYAVTSAWMYEIEYYIASVVKMR
jgi:hypothetical protein